MRLSLVPVIVALAVSTAASQEPLPTNAALIARAKSFELDTPYVPPPGDALEHHTSGFAKIMCSAVFITGLDPDFAAENVGYFTSPYAERAKVGKPVIDRPHQNSSHHAPKWNHAHGQISWEPGMRDPTYRPELGEFHAGNRQERIARPIDAAMANG
jgi:hypothetical protein